MGLVHWLLRASTFTVGMLLWGSFIGCYGPVLLQFECCYGASSLVAMEEYFYSWNVIMGLVDWLLWASAFTVGMLLWGSSLVAMDKYFYSWNVVMGLVHWLL